MVAPMSRRRTNADAGAAGEGRRSSRGSWLTAAAIAKATGGEVLQRGATAIGVTTDSRGDCSGRLFVALRGDKHDAHAFLGAAAQAGAAGLLVDRQGGELPALDRLTGRAPFVVRVPDTGKALLDLAAEHRHCVVLGAVWKMFAE